MHAEFYIVGLKYKPALLDAVVRLIKMGIKVIACVLDSSVLG
jgi:hypothetical protein